MTKPPFILIDGSSYLYRAFHALPPLTNSAGQPTGVVFGVINMIRKLVNEYHPKYIAIVFDAKGKNFRHDLYPKYKANRPPMPDDLRVQIEPLHHIIRAMRIPLLSIEGVEADDVIGTLAKQATKAGLKTLISTGDKDITQLVDDHVTLINTMTNLVLDTGGVKQKFGVLPEQMIDYLTLVGDSSDNIPGVEKVGPKTAVKWLEQYGSLDNIIKHADEIPGKIGENLRASLDQIQLSKNLVTIRCDVPVDFKITDLIDEEDDKNELKKIFTQLEFKTWLKDYENGQSNPIELNYKTIFTQKELDYWIEKIKSKKLVSVDTETTSLDYMNAELVGISFAIDDESAYLPLAHDYENAPEQLNRDSVLKQLRPLLEDTEIKKIGHHLKYDKAIFANYNIELNGITFDTMLESYVVNSSETRYDMDSLAKKYLNYQSVSFEDICGKGAKQITFNQVDIETASKYASEDAFISLKLHEKLWSLIKDNAHLKSVFETIEMPLVNVLSRMERTGVFVDAEYLNELSLQFGKRIELLEQEAFKMAGVVFNLDSPKQLQEIFYERLGMPILKKTPTGQASTAEPILQELALNFPLPKIILEHRSLSKLKSTYSDKLPQQINKKTGRVHTSYHQAGTSTGRLSSSNPNLQNIPIRNEDGRKIRQAFISSENHFILAADYSQIELRIMAHLSKDKGLIDAFHKQLDIHTATAAKVFNIPADQVTLEHRRKAKAINFGLIYGMSAFGLAKQIDVSRTEAQKYIDDYFNKYPLVYEYMENARKIARKNGFVETLYGRRLYIPEINSKNLGVRNAAERAAINAPMQGTAADIIKLAMIQIDQWIQSSRIDVKMIMQVHDELVFEVAKTEAEKAKKQIQLLMENVAELLVPIAVNIGVGQNWDEAH